MASSSLKSSLTTTFETNSDGNQGDSITWEEDAERTAELDFDEKAMRLYPKDVQYVYSTTGSLRKSGSDTDTVEEYLHFTGSYNTSISKPKATDVTIQSVGPFIGIAAQQDDGSFGYISVDNMVEQGGEPQECVPTFSFNPAKNQIESDIYGWGTVKVTYKVSYDVYKFSFAGGPCPDLEKQLQGAKLENIYDDALLSAIDSEGNHATTTLTGPSCDALGFGVLTTGAQAPKVKLIVDPDYKPRFVGIRDSAVPKISRNWFPFDAWCKIRAIPSSKGIIVQAANGDLRSYSSGGFTNTEEVDDAISFNGGESANFKYIPKSGSIQIAVFGTFYDKFGNVITDLHFAYPGDTVTIAEWHSSSRYDRNGIRDVMDDEIVATTALNVAIPCYGSIQASYIYTYDSYGYTFDKAQDDTLSGVIKAKFQKARIFAFANSVFLRNAGMVASLSINPPNIKVT